MAILFDRRSKEGASSALEKLRNSLGAHSNRLLALGIAGIAVVVLAVWYIWGSGGSSVHSHDAPAVRVARVARRDMAVVEHTLGTVIANQLVQITARVQGTLDAVHFKEGQFVHRGDLLFEIDPRPFQVALHEASALLLRDQALLRNAQRDRQRYDMLARQNAISSQLRDTSAANADALIGTVAADQAAVAGAELNLSYTQIRSPVDGKTGPLLVQPGDMVTPSGTAPLITVAQIQPVKVSFNLPQSDLPRIQARQKAGGLMASLEASDASGARLAAPVDFVSNAVSAQSGTIELRATFDNRDAVLVPGALINVTVSLDDLRSALVVPRNAINDGPNGTYVYVIVGGKAERRDVQVLFDDSRDIAVSGSVSPADQVVTEGQLLVVAGAPVKVLAPPATSGAGQPVGKRRGGKSGARP